MNGKNYITDKNEIIDVCQDSKYTPTIVEIVTVFKYSKLYWHSINVAYLEGTQIGMIGAVLEKLWLNKRLANVSPTTT